MHFKKDRSLGVLTVNDQWLGFFFCLLIFIFVFVNRVSLSSSGCPEIHYVDQAVLEPRDLLVSAS